MNLKFLFLIVFLFHRNVYCLATGSGKESIIQSNNTRTSLDLATLCPYNRFCRSSQLKDNISSDQMPCCEKCSCELDCHETGSCCPDMPLVGIVKPKYPCINLSKIDKKLAGLPSHLSNFWFHVVSECSDNRNALAYPRCFRHSKIQDFVVVSDPESGIVYRNKHCAECNNIKTYVIWKLSVLCLNMSHLTQLKSFGERDRYLLENCSLSSLPPDATAGDMSYCAPDSAVVSTCNSTGEWDFYDKEIAEACLENRDDQNALFTKDVGTEGDFITYASVYCYLCNTAKKSQKNDVCKPRTLEKDSRGWSVSLSAIVDHITLEEDTELQSTRCKSTEIWDPFMIKCRLLLCPPGKIPVHGSCRGLFATLDGYSIAVHFEVLSGVKSMTVNKHFLLLLKYLLNRELGTDLKCGDCLSSLLTEKNSSTPLFLRLELYSTEECPHDLLLQRIQKIAVKKQLNRKYKHQGQIFDIALKLIFKQIQIGNTFQSVVHLRTDFCKGLKLIDSSISQYCPRIKLSMSETNTLGIGSVRRNSHISSLPANHTSVEFQEVCVDTYFLAQQIKSSAAPVSSLSLDFEQLTGIWLILLYISSKINIYSV